MSAPTPAGTSNVQNSRRAAYSPSRIIPRLCRHETLLSPDAVGSTRNESGAASEQRLGCRRTAYDPLRVIPRLCRHETMLGLEVASGLHNRKVMGKETPSSSGDLPGRWWMVLVKPGSCISENPK